MLIAMGLLHRHRILFLFFCVSDYMAYIRLIHCITTADACIKAYRGLSEARADDRSTWSRRMARAVKFRQAWFIAIRFCPEAQKLLSLSLLPYVWSWSGCDPRLLVTCYLQGRPSCA